MTILDTIIEHKRVEQAQKLALEPLAAVERRALGAAPARGFRRAIERGNAALPRVIAEVKRASPSKGLLRPDLQPDLLARQYAAGGAAALSVLTDERFFQGSFADLAAARAAVELPALRKDFLIDVYGVFESRAGGADAILLIASVLDRRQLREMRLLAAELGMAALVEVHTEAEMDAAIESGAEIIGVNNRDLRTFTVDLGLTERLAVRRPANALLVAESGIGNYAAVQRLADCGADAILVGEALVTQPQPTVALQILLGGAVTKVGQP